MFMSVSDGQIKLLIEMGILPITSIQRMVVCRSQRHCTT